MAEAFPEAELDCTIEVALPDGGHVKARENGLRLDLAQLYSPTVPVLYDPLRPDRVIVHDPLGPGQRTNDAIFPAERHCARSENCEGPFFLWHCARFVVH